MKTDEQSLIKEYFAKMEKYYDKAAMQNIYNIVDDIDNRSDMNLNEALEIVSSMKLSDRYTAIALAAIYEKPMAYVILQSTTDMLTHSEVKKLKESIKTKTIDEFFKDYNKYDFQCLERSIEEDFEGQLFNPAWDIEKEILINVVKCKEGTRKKVLSK